MRSEARIRIFILIFSWILSGAGIGLGLSGCRSWLEGSPVIAPHYIEVDRIVVTDTGLGGPVIEDYTPSHMWVYGEGQLIGVVPLPGRLPVTGEGPRRVRIYAGMLADGIGDQRVQYAFIDPLEDTLVVTPGGLWKPTVRLPLIRNLERPFPGAETFEDLSRPLAYDSGRSGQVPLVVATDDPAPAGGRAYGIVRVPGGSNAGRVLEIGQRGSIRLPQTGEPVYAEFLYRCNVSFVVGVIAISPGGGQSRIFDLTVLPQPGWRKLYVSLSDEVRAAAPGSRFELFLQGSSTGAANDEFIAVDNLRWMHAAL